MHVKWKKHLREIPMSLLIVAHRIEMPIVSSCNYAENLEKNERERREQSVYFFSKYPETFMM